jgi:hypothetical protein
VLTKEKIREKMLEREWFTSKEVAYMLGIDLMKLRRTIEKYLIKIERNGERGDYQFSTKTIEIISIALKCDVMPPHEVLKFYLMYLGQYNGKDYR